MDNAELEPQQNKVSVGQLYVAGELLNFTGYANSVHSFIAKITPGAFLSDYQDFEQLLKENANAEIFIKDLMLTGDVEITQLAIESGAIVLTLEFRDVIYNAEKLWHKRRFYRKSKQASGVMIVEGQQLVFNTIDVSAGGLMLHLVGMPDNAPLTDAIKDNLHIGFVVKIISHELNVRGMAKIVWIDSEQQTTMGLSYLQVDNA